LEPDEPLAGSKTRLPRKTQSKTKKEVAMNRNTFTTLAITLVTAFCCSEESQAGNGSNRNQVRARVAAGGWEVVWGVNINEAE